MISFAEHGMSMIKFCENFGSCETVRNGHQLEASSGQLIWCSYEKLWSIKPTVKGKEKVIVLFLGMNWTTFFFKKTFFASTGV